MAAGETTLGAIRTAIRQRADVLSSQFVTDAELNAWINASACELYDVLIQHYGDDYYVKAPIPTITADGTNDQFALPTDTYKVLGVDLQFPGTGTGWLTLRPFMLSERNRVAMPPLTTVYGTTNICYRLSGKNIWFTPKPQAGSVFRILYIPRLAALVNDNDVLDGVSGWEEYIVADCCVKVLAKREDDPSVFMAQKAALLQRIESAAGNRDAGAPMRVTDVQILNPWFGYTPGGWR